MMMINGTVMRNENKQTNRIRRKNLNNVYDDDDDET